MIRSISICGNVSAQTLNELTCSGRVKLIDSIHSLIARITWLMMFFDSYLLVSGLM